MNVKKSMMKLKKIKKKIAELKGKKKDFVNSTRSLESFSKNFSCDTRE
jgi:hypothetical protein